MNELKIIENKLVPVYETDTGEKVVYGTELHDSLDVKSNYREWVGRRFSECDAIESTDYSFVEISTKGRPAKNHIIKLDVAKEMAMLERNERGKEVRRYFIEIEKRHKSQPLPTGQNLIALALVEANRILEEKDSTIKVQEQIIGEMKPKADYVDDILKNKSLLKISSIAKDYGMSGQAMNNLLHALKVQYKSGDQWLLYAKHQSSGYTSSETVSFTRTDGRTDVKLITKWTQKGRLFLYELLKKQGVVPMVERKEGDRNENILSGNG